MIRISMGKIAISTRTSDRWGQTIKYWQVNDWAYIEENRYKDLCYFEEPLKNETDVEYVTETIKEKLRRLHAYSVVYQFNAEKKKGEYYRMVAIMNNKDLANRIQEVPWFDAYVKVPVYSLICKVANKLIRDKKCLS